MIEPTNKKKNMKPTIDKELNKKPTVTNKSKNARNMSIHFAHLWGHSSESGSRLVISTTINVTTKITGTNSIFSTDSLKTATQPNKKHMTGNITKAIPGLLKARIMQRTKINIAIIVNILYPIIIQTKS
jgi:hypothetical protein